MACETLHAPDCGEDDALHSPTPCPSPALGPATTALSLLQETKPSEVKQAPDKETVAAAEVLTVWTNQGGVGKTTYTYAVASALVSRGHCVLMVDLSEQRNLTRIVCKSPPSAKDHLSLFDLWNDLCETKEPPSDKRLPVSLAPGFWLSAGHGEISDVSFYMQLLHTVMLNKNHVASNNFATGKEPVSNGVMTCIQYMARRVRADKVVIDCCSAKSELNRCVLMASDYWLLPVSNHNATEAANVLTDAARLFTRTDSESSLLANRTWTDHARLLHEATRDCWAPYPLPRLTLAAVITSASVAKQITEEMCALCKALVANGVKVGLASVPTTTTSLSPVLFCEDEHGSAAQLVADLVHSPSFTL